MNVFLVAHPIHNQETFQKPLNFVYFIEFYLRLCWLVSLALETISGTNTIHHILEDQSLRIPLWTEVQGWCNPTTFSGTKASGYHSELKFKDDRILAHSRGPRSPDTFWTEVQGWCNPTTFTGAKTSRYILNRSSGMMQSLFILEDQGHWITLGQVPRDDTIPLQHHCSPFQGRSFWTTPSLSQKCS